MNDLWQDNPTQDEPERLMPRRGVRDDGELDITPMIDITFLLLIFFLVASIPDPQTAIKLPSARYGVGVDKKSSTILTVIDGGLGTAPVYDADGRVAGQELSLDIEKQSEQIRDIVQRGVHDGKSHVLIKADGNVKESEVLRVAAAASQVEGIRLHVGVLEEE